MNKSLVFVKSGVTNNPSVTHVNNTTYYEMYLDVNYCNYAMEKTLKKACYSRKGQSIRGPLVVKCKKRPTNLVAIGRQSVINEISHVELQEALLKYFKRQYNILAGEVWGADKIRAYQIDKDNVINYNDVNKWRATGDGYNILSDLLTIMCIEEVILPGKYLVTL